MTTDTNLPLLVIQVHTRGHSFLGLFCVFLFPPDQVNDIINDDKLPTLHRHIKQNRLSKVPTQHVDFATYIEPSTFGDKGTPMTDTVFVGFIPIGL